MQGARMRMCHTIGTLLREVKDHPDPEVKEILGACAAGDGMNLETLAIACGALRDPEDAVKCIKGALKKKEGGEKLDEKELALLRIFGAAFERRTTGAERREMARR